MTTVVGTASRVIAGSGSSASRCSGGRPLLIGVGASAHGRRTWLAPRRRRAASALAPPATRRRRRAAQMLVEQTREPDAEATLHRGIVGRAGETIQDVAHQRVAEHR